MNDSGTIVPGGKYGIDWQASISPKGYILSEVRSALIKEMRLGREEDSVFWGLELLDTEDATVVGAVWADLLVYAVEDVGLADPQAIVVVSTALHSYDRLPSNDPRRRLFFVHAVLYLAAARKTRYGNEMLAELTHLRKNGLRRDMPDYAIDMHTTRGRALGRGLEHYLVEATRLADRDESYPEDYRNELLKRARGN